MISEEHVYQARISSTNLKQRTLAIKSNRVLFFFLLSTTYIAKAAPSTAAPIAPNPLAYLAAEFSAALDVASAASEVALAPALCVEDVWSSPFWSSLLSSSLSSDVWAAALAKSSPSDGRRSSEDNSPVTPVPFEQRVVAEAARSAWKVTAEHW